MVNTLKRRDILTRLKMFLRLRERLAVYAEFSTRGLKNRDKYLRTASLVSQFEKEYGRKIYTDSFDQRTTDAFIDFLFEVRPLRRVGYRQSYSLNTVINHVRALSCMLKYARNLGFRVRLHAVSHCRLKPEESTAVYLTLPEIQQLMDCQCLTPRERQVRDLFVIGCCTALRYSDFTALTTANFINGCVSVLTRKTHKPVLVPYHQFVPAIIERNKNRFDFLAYRSGHNYFNTTIREVCRKAGICNRVSVTYTENRMRIEKIFPKWQCVGSHTARRSAATNMIRCGMGVNTVMTFTGHSTTTSFFRYLRQTLEQNASDNRDNTFFQNGSEPPMYGSDMPGWKSKTTSLNPIYPFDTTP